MWKYATERSSSLREMRQRLPLRILAVGTVAAPAAVVQRMLLSVFRTDRLAAAVDGRAEVADVLEHNSDVCGGMTPRGPARTEADQGILDAAFHDPLHWEDHVGGPLSAGRRASRRR